MLRGYCENIVRAFLEEYFCNDKDFHQRKRIRNDKIFIAEGME